MNWMPSIPTDNLYKFSAITGMWMVFGILIFFGWLISIDIQLEKDSRESQLYFFSVNMLRDIEQRQDAITHGRLDDHRFDWVPKEWSAEQETLFLNQAAENHRTSIKKYQHVIDSQPGKDLNIFERKDVVVICVTYVFFAVSLFWFGFSRWKKKIHDVDIQLRDLEIEIRKQSLEKLKLEVAHARRTIRRVR